MSLPFLQGFGGGLLRLIIIFMEGQCAFCQDYREGELLVMMTDAVYAKHSLNQGDAHLAYIDAILRLQEPATAEDALACCRHNEWQVLDERDQFMKREYAADEWSGKLAMLSEYYKFHSNVPRVVQPRIERVLGRYYDKKRECDYRRIKKLLKEQQGISITSVQDSESDCSSPREKRSRYSTLLNDLDRTNDPPTMSDSNLLKDLCKQIERVLPTRKKDGGFQIKGAFYHDAIFEKYLKRQQMKTREQLRHRNQERRQNNAPHPHLIHTQPPRRPSKELRRKEREREKPVFNTNIKIEIKNAMFCTEEQLRHGNFESQGSKALLKGDIFRKKLMNPVFFDSRQPSSKFLQQIYRPTVHQETRRRPTPTRSHTKESLNQSKQRKKTQPRQSTSQTELRRGTNGSSSARKIVIVSETSHSASKTPLRASSSTNLKSRSLSSQSVSAAASLASSNKKQSPIEVISRYGSSNLKEKRVQQKVQEAISRKLTLRMG